MEILHSRCLVPAAAQSGAGTLVLLAPLPNFPWVPRDCLPRCRAYLCLCTEGKAWTTSPQAAAAARSALHGGPAGLEGVRANLGLFSLASGSMGGTVVRQETARGQVSCPPDLQQCWDVFWHFPDLNFKYFWGLYFAPACFPMAAPSVDEILFTRMLQRLG